MCICICIYIHIFKYIYIYIYISSLIHSYVQGLIHVCAMTYASVPCLIVQLDHKLKLLQGGEDA